MRTAYLGTSDFAATVLRRLADSPHRPALVVTPPDRRQGRGRKVTPPPAALAARELGLELLQAENVNEEAALERIRAAAPEAVVVCAFGQLIREPLLSELPMLNVHPSLLPRWRGAAPIERAIMAGDERTGVCVMRLTAGLDSGPVALREEVAIGPEEDFEALSARLAELGGELLVRALDLQAEGKLEFAEQDEDGVTYAEKIEPAERRLDPARPAAELAAKVRALTPHVGAYLETAGRRAPRRPPRRTPSPSEVGAGEARGRARARCCSAAARARCGSSWSSRPAASRCRPTPTCAATRCRLVSAAGGRRRLDASRRPARSPSRRSAPPSRTTPSPSAPSAPRPTGSASTAATAPRRSGSPTAPSSAAAPATSRSNASPGARPGCSTRRCWRRCASASTSCSSPTPPPTTPPSTRRSS